MDLADEDGGEGGVEEVFEELFCEGLVARHWGLVSGGRSVLVWCVGVRLIVHNAP